MSVKGLRGHEPPTKSNFQSALKYVGGVGLGSDIIFLKICGYFPCQIYSLLVSAYAPSVFNEDA